MLIPLDPVSFHCRCFWIYLIGLTVSIRYNITTQGIIIQDKLFWYWTNFGLIWLFMDKRLFCYLR